MKYLVSCLDDIPDIMPLELEVTISVYGISLDMLDTWITKNLDLFEILVFSDIKSYRKQTLDRR